MLGGVYIGWTRVDMSRVMDESRATGRPVEALGGTRAVLGSDAPGGLVFGFGRAQG